MRSLRTRARGVEQMDDPSVSPESLQRGLRDLRVLNRILGAYGPVRKQANIKAARAQIGVFESALGLYQVNIGDYPQTDQGLEAMREAPSALNDPDKWAGPYLAKAVPNDPWGQPYQYEYPGTHDDNMPDIWSMGPDMVDGTDDDVGNWVEE